jgi:hypothetical protein
MLEVKKTTYEVDGCEEPCWEVSNGYTMVRIAPFYYYIGHSTIMLSEYLGGEFNSNEEWDYDFEELTQSDAIALAKQFSVYL